VEETPSSYIDDQSSQLLKDNLVGFMLSQPKKIADQVLEVISTMAKYFVQDDWPKLMPELIQNIQQASDPSIIRSCFEVFKKICKKYRFLFRSDNLYAEMNYMIESLAELLILQSTVSLNLQMISLELHRIDTIEHG
jgi:exportin-2 (importin alpha re-exporter)